ncbi:MAG: hydrogenase accessory protein HypB [Pseudomonadota bacterium]
MCTICGCDGGEATLPHQHSHGYAGHEPGSMARRVALEQDLLARNDAFAADNRRALGHAGVFALNLLSSPGSGKTTLLVKTIERLAGRLPVAVIEGDQQTRLDAERIEATGAPVTQINTGKGCHLDAHMVGHALEQLPLRRGGLLLIENVGNLVCPAAFDLGEAHKVVVLSVTEGEDKPLKYPDMFRAADLLLLNKCDLLPHLEFDVERALACARIVKPGIRVIRLSATQGQGMDEWLEWLARQAARAGDAATAAASAT